MKSQQSIFKYTRPFQLEKGGVLNGIELAYSTAGTMNADKSNVIWVCHAMTGSSNIFEWWSDMIGAGKAIDPTKYFIICVNMLGSCYGSTGPLSINPESGTSYFHTFPTLTTRDIIASYELLREALDIPHILMLTGGSMGGQQTLEWAIQKPDIIKNIVPIACNAQHSPWGIACNESQRMAIKADPSWQATKDDAGIEGMKAARAMAVLNFRHYNIFEKTQADILGKVDSFRAESYMRHQGKKIAARFNAYSYIILSKVMDSHNVGIAFNNDCKKAMSTIRAKTFVVGVDTDIFFPLKEQQFMADNIPHAELNVIHSDYGHDGFLKEPEQLNKIFSKVLG